MKREKLWIGLLLFALATSLAGCQSFLFHPGKGLDLAAGKNSPTKYIGEHTGVWGLDFGKVEGVGLVTELHGTGSNPPPSGQREYLLDELKTYQEIDDPMGLIGSPDTAMVLIRGMVQPAARKGDRFDLEVVLPPKPRTETSSLKYGFLYKSRLRPMAQLGGKVRKGSVSAVARGSVLIDSLFELRQDAANEVRGIILGGGVLLDDRTLGLTIRNEKNQIRTATSIARAINERFTTVTSDGRIGVATAKNDKIIELIVPEGYRLNVGRYFQVLAQIAFDEKPQDRVNRLDLLDEELNKTASCQDAALRLEAMGLDGIPALKRGLLNEKFEVRFVSAEALAYLGEPDGLAVLAEASQGEPSFRWHALTALSTIKSPQTAETLVGLMSSESAETRYGALRAYQNCFPDDLLSKGEWLADDFYLNVVPTNGPPLIHIARSKRPEIAVFGLEQYFTDDFVYAANGLTVKSTSPGELLMIRYSASQGEERRVCTTQVVDALRNLASLNCSYTELTELLQEAKAAEKLTGRLAIDAVPHPDQRRFQVDEYEVAESEKPGWSGLANLFKFKEPDSVDAKPDENGEK